jgi:hypothetical protein
MRGVVLMGVGEDDLIHWARLYIEPVEQGGVGIEDAVRGLPGSTDQPVATPASDRPRRSSGLRGPASSQ